jgi:outer membrane protein TolC
MRAHFRPLLAAALLLSGCAAGPHYRTPKTTMPSAFAAQPAATTAASASGTGASADLTRWWHSFNDPELDSLIDRAVKANPDVELALTRLQEARTRQAGLVGSALPEVVGSADAGRGTGSDMTRAGAAPALRAADNKGDLDQIRQVAGFAASWELDLFGGYRRAIEAGHYDVQAAAAMRNAVLISVIAEVAREYVDLRGLQSRLGILRSNIDAAQQSFDLEQTRYQRGFTNELDLQLATRELARLKSQLPLLNADVAKQTYAIAALLGQYPAACPTCLPPSMPACPHSYWSGDRTYAQRSVSWPPPPHASAWPRPICFHMWH